MLKNIRFWIKYSYIQLSRKAFYLQNRIQMTEFMYMIILSVIIGFVAGFGSVGVKYLIEFISRLAFSGDGNILEIVSATPWYLIVMIPTLGGLFVGLFANFVVPESKGHGVTEVIQSLLTKGGVIKPIVAVGKSITSAVTIGTGGSVGFEGPIVQIGASIGSTVGQFFKVPSRRLRTLVGCGAAAGIAATFNMPIAGALFAIEVIMMDYAAYQLFPIIISSVIATVISHHYFGNYAEFIASPIILDNYFEIINFFVLGVFCGLISFFMIKSIYFFEDLFHNKIKIPVYIKPAIGGLIIGIIGIHFPYVIGVGNDSIMLALNNNMIWYMALSLIFIKIVSTSITLGSGGSGGMLSPALFVGAMSGFSFGYGLEFFGISSTLSYGTYAFIAMGGLIAGTVRAPLTAILMVFELSKQSSSILPLMIVVTISIILSTKLSRESVYTLKLVMDKIRIKSFNEKNILRSIPVKDVYTNKFISLKENTPYGKITETLLKINDPCISVVSLDGKFMGIVSMSTLKETLLDNDFMRDVVIAGDIADKMLPNVTIFDDCYKVMDLCRIYDIEGIPVVDDEDKTKQLGMIWIKDVNDYLQKEVEHIEHTSDLATKISQINKDEEIPFIPGYVIAELKAPKSFIGRTISGLKVRSEYGVEIISIKKYENDDEVIKALPKADYIISEGDSLIIAGQTEKVNILRDLN